MAVLADRAWMTTATTGQGTMTLGSAIGGYATFAEAGITNGQTVTYCIRDGDDYEIGRGTYTSSGTTLSRDTVLSSKISGSAGTTKLNLSGAATVFVGQAVADLLGLNTLSDPGADRGLFWDDSSSSLGWFQPANGLQFNSSSLELTTNYRVGSFSFSIDGGGAVITTGAKPHIRAPFSGTLTAVRLLANSSGSIVVDIHKDTYANFPPTSADSITGSSQPTISSASKFQSTALSGWTVSFSAGDIFQPYVRSSSLITQVTLELEYTRASS